MYFFSFYFFTPHSSLDLPRGPVQILQTAKKELQQHELDA